MATDPLVSLLRRVPEWNDRPEAEFVDGKPVERNLGEKPHSKVQVRLVVLFSEAARRRPLHVFTEIRLRVDDAHHRVADLAVFSGTEPDEDVPSSPPLIAVEIVSRDDRYMELLRKLEEYRSWGVPHVWLVDPWLKQLNVYEAGGLRRVDSYSVRELSLELTSTEVFQN